jgi:hypothetical protein
MPQNIYRSWARVAGAPPSPGREGGDMADPIQYREDDSRYDSSTLKKCGTLSLTMPATVLIKFQVPRR